MKQEKKKSLFNLDLHSGGLVEVYYIKLRVFTVQSKIHWLNWPNDN